MTPVVAAPGLARRLGDGEADLVVIGATGWLGRATLDALLEALGAESFRRRVRVLGSRERTLTLAEGVEVRCTALADAAESGVGERPLVFHNAFLTRDQVAHRPLDEYVALNREISHRVLDLVRAWRPRGVFLPSSGAVYKTGGRDLEDDLEGNPYGVLKLEDERGFAAACEETSSALVITRIFGLSGEYINKPEAYALADMILQLKRGGRIEIRAERPVFRSYVYVGDLLALAVAVLDDGGRETFDTAGERMLEMADLAETIRTVLGRPEAPVIRTFRPELPEDRYVGAPGAIHALAARHRLELLPIEGQVARTAAWLAGGGEAG